MLYDQHNDLDDDDEGLNYLEAFKKAYFAQFAFLWAPDKAVICDHIHAQGLGKSRNVSFPFYFAFLRSF